MKIRGASGKLYSQNTVDAHKKMIAESVGCDVRKVRFLTDADRSALDAWLAAHLQQNHGQVNQRALNAALMAQLEKTKGSEHE